MLHCPDLFFFHTDGHGLSRIFSLCPELSNYRIFLFHTEFHGESRIYISCPELSNYRIFLFTRMVTDYHGFFLSVPNYRIIEFLFTRSSTENHGLIFLVTNYRICELLSSHGVPRRITDLFFCHEFANSIIRDKEKHP